MKYEKNLNNMKKRLTKRAYENIEREKEKEKEDNQYRKVDENVWIK